MIIKKNIKITMRYKLHGSSEWFELNVPPEKYYDDEWIEKGEEVDIDSIPLHNQPINYIPDEHQNDIKFLITTIKNVDTSEQMLFKQTFWRNQYGEMSDITEKVDTDIFNDISYHELIVFLTINNTPIQYDILRLSKVNDIFVPDSHVLMTEYDDGSELSNIFTRSSFDQSKIKEVTDVFDCEQIKYHGSSLKIVLKSDNFIMDLLFPKVMAIQCYESIDSEYLKSFRKIKGALYVSESSSVHLDMYKTVSGYNGTCMKEYIICTKNCIYSVISEQRPKVSVIRV